MLFGGRRSTVVPLVTEALDWEHGVFLGSIMSSEKTAAAAGTVGELRFDPFAMLPFCGYNMADYFAHWLKIGRTRGRQAPEDLLRQLVPQGRQDGRFLWPGFGENSRVLAWVFARCAGHGAARETPIGMSRRSASRASTPAVWTSPTRHIAELLRVDAAEWRAQLPHFHEHFGKFENLPPELHDQLKALEERLS